MAKRVKKSELDPIIRKCFKDAFRAEYNAYGISIEYLEFNEIYGTLKAKGEHTGYIERFSKVNKYFAENLRVYFGDNIVPHYESYDTERFYDVETRESKEVSVFYIILKIDYEIIMK